jgi:hypothetical protein
MGGSYFSKNSRWNGKKNIRILPKLNMSVGISAFLIIGKISPLGWESWSYPPEINSLRKNFSK